MQQVLLNHLNLSSDSQCQFLQWQLAKAITARTGFHLQNGHLILYRTLCLEPNYLKQDVVVIWSWYPCLLAQKEATWLRDLCNVPCLFVPSCTMSKECDESWHVYVVSKAVFIALANGTQHGLANVSNMFRTFSLESKAWDVSIQVSSMAQQADA